MYKRQVHGIEHLGLHLAPAQPPADLDEPVRERRFAMIDICLLYTSDAADERSSVDLGGRRIIKKKIKH